MTKNRLIIDVSTLVSERARMTAITLRSASGKWTYKTTTNDPLFTPILGAMIEAGLELPSELPIEGALGEELERSWQYVEALRQWMQWEKEASTAVEMYCGRDGWNHRYYNNTESDPTVTGDHTEPPTRVVWRHQLSILSNALSLPEGWEYHVAIDSRTTLDDRISHMQNSLEYLRSHVYTRLRLLRCIDAESEALRRNFEDVEAWSMFELSKSVKQRNYRPSYLDPFIRNVWLTMWDENDNRSEEGKNPLGFMYTKQTILLEKLDWEVMLRCKLLPPDYEGRRGRPDVILDLAKLMSGEESTQPSYCVFLGKTLENGLGFRARDFCCMEDEGRLPVLYSLLLSYMPEDSSIEDMGLEPIIGSVIPLAWKRTTPINLCQTAFTYGVLIHRLVGWVNSCTITFMKWYMDKMPRRKDSYHIYKSKDAILVARSEFFEIVEFLGETLGLYAMRRIYLCLLYYLDSNADRARKPSKKTEVTQATKEKREKLLHSVERAELFCGLLEKYITAHEGQDEGVKTLVLGQVERCKALQHYYD